MNKYILSVPIFGLFLITTACSTTADKFQQVSKILTDAMPLVQESKDWEAYADRITKQGVAYTSASSKDRQFVEKKMDAEYPAAIERLASPFTLNQKNKDELAKANKNYVFKYNQIQVVKDKKTSNIVGYCVNYDRPQTGLGENTQEGEKLYKQFIYLAVDRPISTTTASKDFITLVCGQSFYSKYKNPEDK
ncbi:hypothetical protein [Acinetobacter rudis]|uniref:Lipoprotein n=1 Tax=Acinetobacter rudis CIP 110305 TaxID=421052 RepID=S3MWI1_9GAMM|nr:hypothetical protein [Acinetobacter rudis]EPF72140.1 hypothetical protein F945_02191 [Acinetobacter rudis CIP 110305]